jgi:hypothetical protein
MEHREVEYFIRVFLSILALGFAISAHAQSDVDSLTVYEWLGPDGDAHFATVTARIEVPSGYSSNHNYYGEGVITTLTYPDSSQIILLCGTTIEAPLLPKNRPIQKKYERSGRKIWRGQDPDGRTYWREEQLKDQSPFVVTAGYTGVKEKKKDVFNQALVSLQYHQ